MFRLKQGAKVNRVSKPIRGGGMRDTGDTQLKAARSVPVLWPIRLCNRRTHLTSCAFDFVILNRGQAQLVYGVFN